ncbi:5-formyltetrahydrofolate cyclo-ligase [Methylobacterium sp. Leaf361]|nr:5-formyltetrahydrofolate cyclo-ligase [Methylobacterium sp. Leaf361]
MVGHSTERPETPPEPAAPEHSAFGAYSSPPCFMHELGPDFVSPAAEPRPSEPCGPESAASDWPSVRQWRKETRAALIARRVGISAQDRAARSERIEQGLRAALPSASGLSIGLYWPFRGEFDPRSLLTELRGSGARLALPVVVEKARPLQFRVWSPGERMIRGVWNIPVPAEGEIVDPDVLIAPLVGFDQAGYRLGYGGGFYDRTIASRSTKPRVIGVGFELARLATIHPQAHDVPMDIIVTEGGVWPRTERP